VRSRRLASSQRGSPINSLRSHHARHHGEKVKGATSGIASKLSSLSPTLAAVGDKFKGVYGRDIFGALLTRSPHRAAKDKLIGLATGFASKMKTLAVPIAAVGAAIAGLGTAAVLAADNINKAYNAIRVGTGATGEDLEALKSDFDAVFGTIPAGAGEVGTAIADLNTRLRAHRETVAKYGDSVLGTFPDHWD